MIILVLLVSSIGLSLIGTFFVKIIAEKYNFYDIPINSLKDHKKPVPYAGISIWFIFMIILFGLRIFSSFPTGTLHQLRGIVFGGTIIFILGFMDDVFDLDFKVKFFWQAVAAGILIHYGIYIKLFPVRIINVIASIFWVILVTNAINIIDVLDGLSVSVSAMCALGFFAVTLPTENIYVNFASIILFGTLIGFLFFNKPPAKVFMGDAGSLFSGFILAALAMGADYSNENMIGLFSPLLILGIPLYDTILVSYFRYRKGKPIFKGSKDHYALRLSSAGLKPLQIDLISIGVSIFLSAGAFLITVLSQKYAILILFFIGLMALLGVSILDSIEIQDNT